VTAGQIDSIWIDKNGRLYMIDWKRSRKPLLAHASASYGRMGSGPLAHVPDSAYFRYALQQNLYALLLEQRHGLRCDGGLYLLRLHAELGEGAYEMVQCPDMRAEAMALLELEHARLLAESTAAADAGVGASRSPRPRATVAALVLDVETADWLEQEPAARREARRARGDLTEQCKGHQHVGPFGHVAWVQPWETEYQRIIQLGWCTLDAAGAILERREVMVRSGVLVAPKATAYHHITNEMLAASGIPLESALGHLSDALHTLEADGGVLVGHNLTFDAAILLHEYNRIGDYGGAQRLARLATAGRCTMNMARSAQTLPIKVHRPSMEWVCERLGEAMPDPAGGFRRHSALYDAEQTARLYRKLVRMLAAGEKIYAHLPAGAPPAADSVDAPTYLDYRMPSDRRDEVRRLGACWDAVRSRYYVPAGVGLVAFEGWRERPPRREG
jgi:DNA polymerase III epsilon subunit-like protein